MEIIKKGSKVRQVVHVIEGVVIARNMNNVDDELEYLVRYKDKDGEEHERHFAVGEIELVGGTE